MKRSLYGHTLVAVVMVVAAYVAWKQPKDEGELNKTSVISGSVERLMALHWQEERWDVRLSRTSEKDFAVTVQEKAPQPKSAALATEEGDTEEGDTKEGDTGGKPPADEPTRSSKPPKTFPGSDRVDKLLEQLVPLETRRSLGEVTTDRLAAMGLDEPKSQLTLTFGDREHRIEVGGSTYGSGDLYARTGGEVFLIPAASLSSLRHGGSPLLDKNAVGVPRRDVTRVTITAEAQGREVAQRHSDDESKRFFSDPAEPEVKLDMVTNWMEQVWRLRVIDLQTETPPAMIPPAVEIEMFAGPESRGVLRLWPPGERFAVATSSRFPQPFTVSKASAEAILKDVEGVLNEGR